MTRVIINKLTFFDGDLRSPNGLKNLLRPLSLTGVGWINVDKLPEKPYCKCFKQINGLCLWLKDYRNIKG
jgi:hypothetical protein